MTDWKRKPPIKVTLAVYKAMKAMKAMKPQMQKPPERQAVVIPFPKKPQ